MKQSLKDKLASQITIFDGAMGTEIYKKNFFVNTCFDELCLTAPRVISQIHKEYFDAGADVLTTNTYGANFNKLSRFGLGDKIREINRAAVKLARESGNENTLIAGSVGTIGKILHHEKHSEHHVVEMLAEQIAVLEEAGADFIIFETLPSVADTHFAFMAVNKSSNIPYVMSFALEENAETLKGEPLQSLLNVFKDGGRKPDAIGLNCGGGPEGILSSVEKLIRMTELPIIVQPNAGVPKNVEGRMIYMASPEYFTTYAVRFVNLGVRGVGGCCGTSPKHIRDIARSIRPLAKTAIIEKITIKDHEEHLQDPVPMAQKSRLAAKFAKGDWITTVEIVPPKGYDLDSTIEKSKQCKAAGIDAINIPDGPRASSRISPIVTATKIQELAGIETILHFCCRDRNLIGMQSDLLGCAALKINNILFITGDPPKLGDYPFASAVFDVDSIGMVTIQSRLNRGVDIGGNSIKEPTKALIGVGADPNSIDIEREIRRTRDKAAAGAEFIITQPVFAVEPLIKFIEKIGDLNLPVIAGIWPLSSFRNAEFMKNEVPGVVVPDSIMERMAKAKTKEEQRSTGICIAKESIEKIRSYIRGIQVSAPFGNVQTAIDVIKS
ncbi:MAG TPA: bifunctional homocysteine S-methyltransferase/methylenetetrahydrofolate reductase [Lentisphaeria bacterium]|nr:MAG: bifunctional homocysteine S-methyltransferase/methylenetetrahydrofolate reductase [Lentisphaerae bacterium GWF2_50_93]HCE43187.1 bifunctional homocysteine S-methyltransferase/methylenetetrahydrofolate reductase [Lentisphaeria bacterium]